MEEEVCSICGDPGYAEMMVLCDDCNQVSEHIYCMRNHLDEVPEIWFCEACQVRRESDSHCPTTSSNMHQNRSDKAYAAASLQLHEKMDSQGKKQKSIDINEVMVRGLFIPDKRKKGFPKACSPLYKGNKAFKAPEAGKVKFISEAEAAHLRSGAKAMLFYQSPGASGALMPKKGSTSTLPMKNVICRTAKRSFPSRSETTAKNNVDSKLMKDASMWHNDQIRKQTYACVQASEKKTNELGRYGSSNEEPRVATSKKMEKPIDNLEDASTSLRSIVAHPLGRASKRDSSSPTSHLIKNSDDWKHSPHLTLPENWERNISWRGSFEVHGTLFEGNIYQGIEAYRSNSIGHKALEALRRMPTRLIAVLLPRFEVWPRIFQKQFPDADDVALYFLPSDCERFDSN
ncbi:hypothetical protein H6P81_019262 [Aristolochia fimbriata]|uniref:Zinc finger PHD-type domain-containing protein n=1 Tax=Aristolochia fimbriata TaxID=158543 RepID=A0AAV7DUD2_ARIFI|nr:hypothetical protein H6P81_019262 [Aristolochia fimbriata]